MYESPKEPVGFLEAAALFFSRYTDFSGRSRRSEYWWAFLFNTIVATVFAFLPEGLAFFVRPVVTGHFGSQLSTVHPQTP